MIQTERNQYCPKHVGQINGAGCSNITGVCPTYMTGREIVIDAATVVKHMGVPLHTSMIAKIMRGNGVNVTDAKVQKELHRVTNHRYPFPIHDGYLWRTRAGVYRWSATLPEWLKTCPYTGHALS